MRIAQRMVSRSYMSTLNESLEKRTGALDRSASGVKFTKLSDNVADGSRAMHLQEERYKSTQQLDNVQGLLKEFNAVDSNMASIHDLLQTCQERVLKAMDDPKGDTGREVIASEIASMKEQLVQFANSQFAGKYLFSGTQNSHQPFTINDDGKLAFNGVPVENIKQENGKYIDQTTGKQVPYSDEIYADIGLGLKFKEDGQPDTRTAFQVSFSGLKLMGFGEAETSDNGTVVPNNLYDLLTEIEEAIKPPYDGDAMADLQPQLVKLTDQVGMNRTDLGARMNYLERTEARLEAEIDDMSELESHLISSDPAEEAIKIKESEYVWQAVLQIGSMILPTSLLDYMR